MNLNHNNKKENNQLITNNLKKKKVNLEFHKKLKKYQ